MLTLVLYILQFYALLIFFLLVIDFLKGSLSLNSTDVLFKIVISTLLTLVNYINIKKNNLECRIDDIKRNFQRKQEQLQIEYDEKDKQLKDKYFEIERERVKKYEKRKIELDNKETKLRSLLESSYPFKYSASMMKDMKLMIFDDSISYLKYKRHPARSASEEVKKMCDKTKEYIQDYYEMAYQFEYLLSVFPELEKYVNNDEAMKSLVKYEDFEDFKVNVDRSSEYLSNDEWNNLTVVERNQLALDRYKRKVKSNWIIGIEYEMYIDYLLRSKGFKTIPSGSLNGLEDLGRDLIAFKTDSEGNNWVYIIQCKNWSLKYGKEIHENVICQTFGTSVEYAIKHKNELFTKVIPVIYTTVPLSNMAKEFANRLGVKVFLVKKGEYPMIKCNINDKGDKIYHLPFDQQYYRTQINKPGEFYAWTVKEAVDAGFRRAFKFNGYPK